MAMQALNTGSVKSNALWSEAVYDVKLGFLSRKRMQLTIYRHLIEIENVSVPINRIVLSNESRGPIGVAIPGSGFELYAISQLNEGYDFERTKLLRHLLASLKNGDREMESRCLNGLRTARRIQYWSMIFSLSWVLASGYLVVSFPEIAAEIVGISGVILLVTLLFTNIKLGRMKSNLHI